MAESASQEVPRVPDFELADWIFTLQSPHLAAQHEATQQKLLNAIKERNLGPLYYYLHVEALPSIPWDESVYTSLKEANDAKIKTLNEAIEKAEEDEEETASAENWVKLGEYYAEIGDREQAVATLRKAAGKTGASSGLKIDVQLTLIRIGLFFDDKPFVGNELEAVKLLIDRGGDWERRNRYKTYNGLFLISTRKFDEAASLLIDSMATFTSTEVSSYQQIVAFAVLTGAISLDRVQLKKKVIDSPEVLSLLPTTPELEPLTTMTNSLHSCNYSTYFKALAEVEESFLRVSRYTAPHSAYYVREMRRKAYAQLLESYKTLSLKSAAEAFGVSVDFLDADLSKFVPQKRLNCVIDRVNGIIVTNRPDTKNHQYQKFVKDGDALLTKLQKYGAAVRLSGAERVA